MKLMTRVVGAAMLAVGLATIAHAQEAAIRKNLAERLPKMPPIDEVSKTPMQGLFEVRTGLEIFYTDADGSFLLQGQLIDTKQKRNLTEERKDKLLTIDFKALPLKDAFAIVRGNGKRQLAVFEDPNCPYCKHFERDLQKVDNVTVYLFLYPILGPDSTEKSQSLWCARDKPKAWLDWMVRGQPVSPATCDAGAVARNVEFGRKYQINGTPTMIFADGSRVPGAISAPDIEKLLADAKQ